MTDYLEDVIALKTRDIEEKKKYLCFSEFFNIVKNKPPSRPFSSIIQKRKAIIAEIKKASPSKGTLFPGRHTERLGRIYEENGASAISVVTEEKYFKGCLQDLRNLKRRLQIPVLRKDFIVDEYQILESKHLGAAAVLLITSLLSQNKLKQLLGMVKDLGMEALVEVHNRIELQTALYADAKIVGINNRNLKTFKVDINTSKELLPLIPYPKIKIVESGIKDEKDLISFERLNVNAFLIGEALATAFNPGEKLKRFYSVLRKNDKD
jgi:indole-3-glycerol phosphate synthase